MDESPANRQLLIAADAVWLARNRSYIHISNTYVNKILRRLEDDQTLPTRSGEELRSAGNIVRYLLLREKKRNINIY